MTTRKEKYIKMPFITRKKNFTRKVNSGLGLRGIVEDYNKNAEKPESSRPSTQGNLMRLRGMSSSIPSLVAKVHPKSGSLVAKQVNRRNSKIKSIITVKSSEYNDSLDQPILSIDQKAQKLSPFEDVFWIQRSTHGTIACARENSQITVLGDTVYLYGGQSHIKHRDISALNLRTFTWKTLQTQGSPPGRLGHSLVLHANELLLYGGWVSDKLNSFSKCSKHIYKFDLVSYKWKKLSVEGVVPVGRRHHCAVQLGKEMLIYGGINSFGERLSGFLSFDLSSGTWRELKVTFIDPLGARSHLSLTPVFHQNMASESSYSIDALSAVKHANSMKNSGIYLFGGLDEYGTARNDLFVLYFQKSAVKCMEIRGSGTPPSPRHSHTASAMGNCIFVFGGRNDLISISGFSDLHLFSTESLKWEELLVYGSVPESRWGHCMSSYGHRILLLGGLNSGMFMSSDVFELETDPFFVRELSGKRP